MKAVISAVVLFFIGLESRPLEASSIVIILGLEDTLTYWSADSTYLFRFLPSDEIQDAQTAVRGEMCKHQKGGDFRVLWADTFLWGERPILPILSSHGPRVAMFRFRSTADNIVVYDGSGKIVRALDRRDLTPEFTPVVSDTPDTYSETLADEIFEEEPFFRPYGTYEFGWGQIDTSATNDDSLHLIVRRSIAPLYSVPSDYAPVQIALDDGAVVCDYPLVGRPASPGANDNVAVEFTRTAPLYRYLSHFDFDCDKAKNGDYVIVSEELVKDGRVIKVKCLDKQLDHRWDWQSPVRSGQCTGAIIRTADSWCLAVSESVIDTLTNGRTLQTCLYGIDLDGHTRYYTDLGYYAFTTVVATTHGVRVYGRDSRRIWPDVTEFRAFDLDGNPAFSRHAMVAYGSKTAALQCERDVILRQGATEYVCVDFHGVKIPFEGLESLQAVTERSYKGRRAVSIGQDGMTCRVMQLAGSLLKSNQTDSVRFEEGVVVTSCLVTERNETIIAGYYSAPFGDNDLFATKLNAHGDSVWTFRYGTGSPDWACSIVESSPSHYEVGGLSGKNFVVFGLTDSLPKRK